MTLYPQVHSVYSLGAFRLFPWRRKLRYTIQDGQSLISVIEIVCGFETNYTQMYDNSRCTHPVCKEIRQPSAM